MKIRTDFVTNSSSSSFVCQITSRCDGGMNAYYVDYGFCQCRHGHLMDEDIVRKVTNEEKIAWLKKNGSLLNKIIEDEYGKYNVLERVIAQKIKDGEELSKDEMDAFIEETVTKAVDYEYNILGCECPYCMMDYFEEDDLAKYLKKETGIDSGEVFAEVKAHNKNRDAIYPIDYIDYITRKTKKAIYEVEDEIRNRFETYDDFWFYIKGVRL